MACQHVLTNSVTYPVGTRCGRCGKSAESILADVQLQLSVTQSELRAALALVSEIDECKRELLQSSRDLKLSNESIERSNRLLADASESISKQLAQVESLSKENIRLTNELRQAVEREKALQRKLEDVQRTPVAPNKK